MPKIYFADIKIPVQTDCFHCVYFIEEHLLNKLVDSDLP